MPRRHLGAGAGAAAGRADLDGRRACRLALPRAAEIDARDGILDANLMVGYVLGRRAARHRRSSGDGD